MIKQKHTRYYVADFETTTDPNDCRVWLWGMSKLVDNKDTIGSHGTDINSFMERLINLKDGSKVYFHNLKFDSAFILQYLLDNKWEFIHNVRDIEKNKKLAHLKFNTLITDMGQMYHIKLYHNGKRITIIDSLKLLPMSISAMAKTFDMPMAKGDIDYHMYRPVGYIPTEDEMEYLKLDLNIMKHGILFFFNQGLNKLTLSSNALNDYKTNHCNVQFRLGFDKMFPQVDNDVDNIIRSTYKGGYTYVKEMWKSKTILQKGIVFDVNSLYPYIMYDYLLPCYEPQYFNGNYDDLDDITKGIYPLYIQTIKVNFTVKDGYLPTLQLKGNGMYNPTEYITNSVGEEVITLTSVDLQLFKKHYIIHTIEYLDGYMFQGRKDLFKSYIDHWSKVKEENHGINEGLRSLAKLMLNSLYGKFAVNTNNCTLKEPYLDEEGVVRYNYYETEPQKMIYTAMATFITSYARELTINSAQDNYDRFVYCDTDSIHLIGTDTPQGLDVDDKRLGAWKEEYKFQRARFIRAKTYYEELLEEDWKYDDNNNIILDTTRHIGCAGLPHYLHKDVTFDNFKVGLTLHGKKQQRTVKGGIVLLETDFNIKPKDVSTYQETIVKSEHKDNVMVTETFTIGDDSKDRVKKMMEELGLPFRQPYK